MRTLFEEAVGVAERGRDLRLKWKPWQYEVDHEPVCEYKEQKSNREPGRAASRCVGLGRR
jgi:hypothetical protein